MRAVIVSTCVISLAPPGDTRPDGLVAHFTMDMLEDVPGMAEGKVLRDHSGNDNDGTCVGTSCPTLVTSGRIDKAMGSMAWTTS